MMFSTLLSLAEPATQPSQMIFVYEVSVGQVVIGGMILVLIVLTRGPRKRREVKLSDISMEVRAELLRELKAQLTLQEAQAEQEINRKLEEAIRIARVAQAAAEQSTIRALGVSEAALGLFRELRESRLGIHPSLPLKPNAAEGGSGFSEPPAVDDSKK